MYLQYFYGGRPYKISLSRCIFNNLRQRNRIRKRFYCLNLQKFQLKRSYHSHIIALSNFGILKKSFPSFSLLLSLFKLISSAVESDSLVLPHYYNGSLIIGHLFQPLHTYHYLSSWFIESRCVWFESRRVAPLDWKGTPRNCILLQYTATTLFTVVSDQLRTHISPCLKWKQFLTGLHTMNSIVM